MALPPASDILGWVGVLLTATLATTLLALDFQKRSNRAFAVLLYYRAATQASNFAARAADGEWARLFVDLYPYMVIPVVPAAIYFACVFPRPRTWIGRSRAGLWAVVGATVAAELAYLIDHTAFFTLAAGTSDLAILQFVQPRGTSPGIHVEQFGPLSLFAALQLPVLAWLAFVFAHDYLASHAGSQRFSSFLVATGFLLNGLFDGTRSALGLFDASWQGFPWAPWGWAFALLPPLSLVGAVAALTLVLRHHFRERQQERALETRLVAAAVLAVVSAALPIVLAGRDAGFLDRGLSVFVLGVWRLALPVLVSYALFRYALFGIDVGVRMTIRQSTVLAAFAAVYFFVSEGLESVVSGATGQLAGLGAAGLLTVAWNPLQRAGQRVAVRILPHDTASPEARYRSHFEMVQEDGRVTPKERQLLDALRDSLGLKTTTTRRIEDAVLRARSAA